MWKTEHGKSPVPWDFLGIALWKKRLGDAHRAPGRAARAAVRDCGTNKQEPFHHLTFSLPWHSKEQKADLLKHPKKQIKKKPPTKAKSKPHAHKKTTNKKKLCLLGMLTLGLHTCVIYFPHVNTPYWWGITATNESKNNWAFHNYLGFAIMNFSSPPVKLSITKQGVSSFYENQLK